LVNFWLIFTINNLKKNIAAKTSQLQSLNASLKKLNKNTDSGQNLNLVPELHGGPHVAPDTTNRLGASNGEDNNKKAPENDDKKVVLGNTLPLKQDKPQNKDSVNAQPQGAPAITQNVVKPPPGIKSNAADSVAGYYRRYAYKTTKANRVSITNTFSYSGIDITATVFKKDIKDARLSFYHFNSRLNTFIRIDFRTGELTYKDNEVYLEFVQVFGVRDFALDNSNGTPITAIFEGTIDKRGIHGSLKWDELSDNKKNDIPITLDNITLYLDK
jgi:hypothetical protein